MKRAPPPFLIFLFLLHSMPPIRTAAADECSVYYIQEPPNQLQCNPYSPTWSVSLLCIAAAATADNISLSITWYRNTSNDSIESLPSTNSYNGTVAVALLNKMDLLMDNGSMSGECYVHCQVTSADSNVSFVPSNRLRILSPQSYNSESQCSSLLINVDKPRCAVESFLQTTTSISPTLSSSLTSYYTSHASNSVDISATTISPVPSAVQQQSVAGWIAGITLLSVATLALIALMTFILLVICYRKRHKIKEESQTPQGVPVIYRKKKNKSKLSPKNPAPLGTTIPNHNTTKVIPINEIQESYDYIGWDNGNSSHSSYTPRNEPPPEYLQLASPKVLQKEIEGKLYTVADLETRDSSSTYQNLQK